MEILLLACAWLVYTAGAQSEQAKLGLSPAQRDILREQARHEKTVQKIAEKHGVASSGSPKTSASAMKEAPGTGPATAVPAVTVPEAFRSGYRTHTPIERVATPMGRRAGGWAAQGVAWAHDTGRGAVREYRRRRKAGGHADPAPVLVPLPPTRPPDVPPLPAGPPAAGTGSSKGVSLVKPSKATEAPRADATAKPPEGPAGPPAGSAGPPSAPEASKGPEVRPDGSGEVTVKEPAAPSIPESSPGPEAATAGPETEPAESETKDAAAPKSSEETPRPAETDPAPATAESEGPVTAPENAVAGPESPAAEPETPAAESEGTASGRIRNSEPAAAGEGVGRMAAEVTYESVEEESDELSLMCKEDQFACDRIKARADREVGRGDTLLAQMAATGFGTSLQAWVTRCREDYQGMGAHLDNLKTNTLAQDEAVVKAKALLLAGQGVYYDIAQDMEQVAEREAYVSDAVDSEDTSAHTEVYETKGA
ncbi:hypothetical protein RKD18_000121 [Streptomyces phaeoluteigriseus]